MLSADLSPVERDRRVTTAAALIRQAILTVECQGGMSGEAVLAVAKYVLASEEIARASQGARNG